MIFPIIALDPDRQVTTRAWGLTVVRGSDWCRAYIRRARLQVIHCDKIMNELDWDWFFGLVAREMKD